MDDLIEEIVEWASSTLPNAKSENVLIHLGKEIEELKKAKTFEEKSKESADIFILLCHYWSLEGLDGFDAVSDKFEIVKKRTYVREANSEGFFNHVKD